MEMTPQRINVTASSDIERAIADFNTRATWLKGLCSGPPFLVERNADRALLEIKEVELRLKTLKAELRTVKKLARDRIKNEGKRYTKRAD